MPNDMIQNISAINATLFSEAGNFSRPVDWKVLDNTVFPEGNPVMRVRVPPYAHELKIIGSLINPTENSQPEIWHSPSLATTLLSPITIGIVAVIAGVIAYFYRFRKRNYPKAQHRSAHFESIFGVKLDALA